MVSRFYLIPDRNRRTDRFAISISCWRAIKTLSLTADERQVSLLALINVKWASCSH